MFGCTVSCIFEKKFHLIFKKDTQNFGLMIKKKKKKKFACGAVCNLCMPKNYICLLNPLPEINPGYTSDPILLCFLR